MNTIWVIRIVLWAAVLNLFLSEWGVAAPTFVAPDPTMQGVTPPVAKETLPELKRNGADAGVDLNVDKNSSPNSEQERVLIHEIKAFHILTPAPLEGANDILRQFIGKRIITKSAFETLKNSINKVIFDAGLIAEANFFIKELEGGSEIELVVKPIRANNVIIEETNHEGVPSELLSKTKKALEMAFPPGKVINLHEIDNVLMQQMYVGNSSTRAVLVPIDAESANIIVTANATAIKQAKSVVQYDNSGLSNYGVDRYTVVVSAPNIFLSDDSIEIADMHSIVMDYGRIAYELPVPIMAIRLQIWGSLMDYGSVANTHGHNLQSGITVSRLLYANSKANLLGTFEVSSKQQVDWLGDATLTGDKSINSLKLGVNGNQIEADGGLLSGGVDINNGILDISRLPGALSQDASSANTQGDFLALNWNFSVNSAIKQLPKLDWRMALRGQFANKNLDSSEKFILGGPNGVRAYGSIEAMGDVGQTMNLELWYQLSPTIRSLFFYDAGWITQYHSPWTSERIPNEYKLQGYGLGFTSQWNGIEAKFTWAKQIGENPGLNAQGQDSEGHSSRERFWASLVWRI